MAAILNPLTSHPVGDTAEISLIREAEQFINGHAEVDGELREQLDVRLGGRFV